MNWLDFAIGALAGGALVAVACFILVILACHPMDSGDNP